MNQLELKYQEFLEVCMAGLKEELGEGYNIQMNTILKNNSISMDGVVILKDGAKMTPNIYLEEYYESYKEGMSIEVVIQSILAAYFHQAKKREEVEIQFTFDAMKDFILFRLVNKEKNAKLLETCPYIDYLDLAITFHCLIQEEAEAIGTIRITNEHMELWKVTPEILLQYAMKNTPSLMPPLLRRMEEVLKEILTSEDISMSKDQIQIELERLDQTEQSQEDNTDMYILSNTKGINGASCILYPDVIRNFARLLQCDIYLLPSSIHEIILLPAQSFYEKWQLEAMVQEINQNEVPYEEVLSDHVYYYSLQEKQITLL